jgi:hypothetical protein
MIVADGLPAQTACRVLGVSESGYYARRGRPPSQRAIRHVWLTDLIRQIRVASRGTGGARRVHAELTMGYGVHVGHNAGPTETIELTTKRLMLRLVCDQDMGAVQHHLREWFGRSCVEAEDAISLASGSQHGIHRNLKLAEHYIETSDMQVERSELIGGTSCLSSVGAKPHPLRPLPVPASHPITWLRAQVRPDRGSKAATPVQPDQCKPAGQNR